MLDDFYNRKMQLAQALAPRRGLMRQPLQMGAIAQSMPNQNMQTEQSLQQVNEQNMQAAMQDPGTSKQELAKALAGRGFTPAQDWFGVAANALEGYNMGKSQSDAIEEAKKKSEYESLKRNLIASQLPEQYKQIAQADPELAFKLIELNKPKNQFGSGLTGNLAALNYKAQTEGLTPEEQAQYDAIAKTIQMTGGVQYFTDAEGRPGGSLPRKPLIQGQIPANAPLPPAPPSINNAPTNMFEETNQPINADANNDGFVTKTEQAIAEEKAKSEIKLTEETRKAENKKAASVSDLPELISEARSYLPIATEGAQEYAITSLNRLGGKSTDTSRANAALKAIGGRLTAAMPRMEGPQSEYDVKLYQEMAGEVANPFSPIGDRLEALKTIEKITKRYLDLNTGSALPKIESKPKTASDILKEYGIE